jgi:hypothetical protein
MKMAAVLSTCCQEMHLQTCTGLALAYSFALPVNVRSLLHVAVLSCRRGIADLVSEAVMREAASDSNPKVRCGGRPHCRVFAYLKLCAVSTQAARDARKLIGHVDRKLVKQARATHSEGHQWQTV